MPIVIIEKKIVLIEMGVLLFDVLFVKVSTTGNWGKKLKTEVQDLKNGTLRGKGKPPLQKYLNRSFYFFSGF